MTGSGHPISRRRLLHAWLVSAVGAAAATVGGGTTLRGATPEPLSAARLVSLFRDRPSAAAIGRARLAGSPGSGDRDRLERSVVASVTSVAALVSVTAVDAAVLDAGASDRALRVLLDAAIRRDFASADIVRVRGWLLARTEVELCVLAALDAEGGVRS